jgi:serine/threonine protein kinase
LSDFHGDLTVDLPPDDRPGPNRARRPSREELRRSRETAGLPPLSEALADDEDLVGRDLGGFRVTRRLGSGAVGVVYLAEQVVLRRPVALKVLSASRAANGEYMARFTREAHAVARLVHPNAVQIYDVGTAGGYHYIALEYVDGEPLSELIEKRGCLSWSAALEVTRQAALSLSRAHELGIVHRDIKPENLLVTRRGEIKVADFGLARLGDDPAITHHGTILGTPFYMSPEQADGREAGPAADLYSLGCTLYHMLVGHPPFEAVTALDIVHLHVTAVARAPHEIEPEVPVPVSRLALQLMAKSPAERPESARRLIEMISAVRRQVESGLAGPGPGTLQGAADAESANIREILGPEGRTYRRVPVDMVATVRQARLPDKTRDRLVAKVLNLSRGGLFLCCDDPAPAGTLMELSFRQSEESDIVEGLAVVRWVSDQPRGMGLEFVRLKDQEVGRVNRLIAHSESRVAIQALTRTELHQRLLRVYYTDMRRRASLAEMAEQAGTSVVVLREGLKPFIHHGLVRLSESGLEFRPPVDTEVLRRIERWVLEHGLLGKEARSAPLD